MRNVTLQAHTAPLMADYGWHIFPVQPGGKTPLVRNGQNEATTDVDQVLEWWTRWPNANIGIHCRPSGLYVVDLDRHDPEKDGVRAWRALCARHGAFRTRMATTPSGGYHLYYRGGDGLKNSAGKLAPGIDTRGNGYVVAPPSTTAAGAYAWVEPKLGIAPLPDWITEALSSRAPASAPARPPRPPAHNASVHARVCELADAIANAPEGQGNNTCAEVAYKVGQYVGAGQISMSDAYIELLGALSTWTFKTASDEDRMRKTLVAQLNEGSKSPRTWSL